VKLIKIFVQQAFLTYTFNEIMLVADLITETKKGQNRFYSLNRKTTSEIVRFFDDMDDYNLNSLKEYIENKGRKGRKRK
jgi:hypothetical protein